MDIGIAGKLAVVTGASSGLGESIAHALAAEGAHLALFARTPERLTRVAGDIQKRHGVQTLAVYGDMRSPQDIDRLASAICAEFSGPDILVVNTGRPPMPPRDALEETDDARWEDAYRTQLFAAALVLRKFVPMQIHRGWGRVIAVTSNTVRQPMEKHTLSTVFRLGVTGYLKHLANETASSGVTVNAVCPALIETQSLQESYNLAERARCTPMGRVGTSDELAAAVVFLASRQAAYITGVSLPVDGGQTTALF